MGGQNERCAIVAIAHSETDRNSDEFRSVQGCGSKESTLQTGINARRDSLCRITPGNARLAVARFAHPGLRPAAHFGAEEDGFVAMPIERSDAQGSNVRG